MKVVNASTIGNLISAHYEHDEKKFLAYANFIADAYKEAGDDLSERIIRKRIDGSYKNDPVVTLDSHDENKPVEKQLIPELQEEFDFFLQDMASGRSFGKYLEEDAYEDDYSHNDIEKMQAQFVFEIRKWLHENKPGEYIAKGFDYCVLVMTPAEAEKRLITRYEEYIVQ